MTLSVSDARIDPLFGGTLFVLNNAGVIADLNESAYSGIIGLVGGGGNDTLRGNANNNHIWGGSGGNDALNGGSGHDTFYFGHGDSHDTLLASSSNQLDTVNFYNVSPDEMSFSQSGYDLITTLNTGETLTLAGWYAPTNVNSRIANATFATNTAHHLNFQFDYRYDTTGFFTTNSTARTDLTAAANFWSAFITDDFPNLSAGANISVFSPTDPMNDNAEINTNYDSAIDDIVVFPGGAAASRVGGNFLGLGGPGSYYSVPSDSPLISRYGNPTAFEPWAGMISINMQPVYSDGSPTAWYFDATPDTAGDVPHNSVDLISVEIHEIGHILGICAGVPAFDAHMSRTGGQYYFTGPNAVSLFGGPVPFFDSSHPDGSRLGVFSSVMSYNDSRPGYERLTPTSLDKAILKDLGYHIS